MLNPGKSSLPHYLKESIEVYYILDGEGLMDINNETKKKVRLGGCYFHPAEGSAVYRGYWRFYTFLFMYIPYLANKKMKNYSDFSQ